MKVFVAAALTHACSAANIKGKSSAAGSAFGPENCVALTRSSAGSCVISTDCEGADLSQTEFAFDCVKQGGEIVRHSFGVGGFETSEEFDSQVSCDRCESASPQDSLAGPPGQTPNKKAKEPQAAKAPVASAAQAAPQPVVLKAEQQQKTQSVASSSTASQSTAQAGFWPFTSSATKSEPEVVKYGPNGCVSTWKSSENHCIIRTNCKDVEDISKYQFGLVCVDKVGSPVRHLFGTDSFDKEETFDTLIKCDKCLGLEDIPDAVALNGEVVSLSKDIANLKDVMKNISINVQMLNAEVFKVAPAAPAPAPAVASPAPAVALVHQKQRSQKVIAQDAQQQNRNLRHSHRRHRQEDEEEEEDNKDEYDEEYDEGREEDGDDAADYED